MNDEREKYDRLFDEVANPEDWRAPINAIVEVNEDIANTLNSYMDAITFYTAIHPKDIVIEFLGKNRYNIYCVGYRMGPAGP